MKIGITGGAGYVGCLLAKELSKDHEVSVLDLFIYGENVLSDNIKKVKGDIRNTEDLEKIMDVDVLFHLACISNDPSFELDPQLGRSINLDAFDTILSSLEKSDVKKFIYASSSSVYGISDLPQVTEDTPKTPLTDYSKFKLECEEKLLQWDNTKNTDWSILRPATVCGYSPRLRLDLVVNILTINALVNGKIKVFGGKQIRSNIHIDDMVNAYLTIMNSSVSNGQIYNVGCENHPVMEIANLVKHVVEEKLNKSIEIEFIASDDNRSYHINSDKIKNELGFIFKKSIYNAIEDIIDAYEAGKIVDGLNNPLYHNVKMMLDFPLN